MGANSPEAFWRSGEPQKTTAIPHSLTKAGIKRQNLNTGHIFFALFVRGKPAPFASCPIGQGFSPELRAFSRLRAPLRQNGVGHNKTCADAILPKGHTQVKG
jgi:hypothetical protein